MIWAIGLSELRVGRRLVRTWFVVGFAFLIAGYYFWEQSSLYASASSFSASVGMLNPKHTFAASSTVLLLVFQIGIVLLVFDARTREARARIAEAFAARPFTNSELLGGKLLGITLLMSIPAAVLVVLLLLISFVLYAFQAPFGEMLEPYSVLSFLLLDLVPNLAFWCALTIFVVLIVRSGLLAATLSITAMITVFVINALLPAYLLPATAYASSTVLLPSELAPEFANGWVLSQRFFLVTATVGLVLVSALLYPRQDDSSRIVRSTLGLGFLLVATGVQSTLISNAVATHGDFERIASLHESISTQPRVDIEHIAGSLVITPGNNLDMEYQISFVAPAQLANELVFAFNNGFEIKSLWLDDEQVQYEFSDGLIRIPYSATETKRNHELVFTASGYPNTSFGYLDAVLNKYSVNGPQARSLTILGVHNAIFHDQYVALTPAVKWYPTAGPAYGEDNLEQIPQDQFTVDLEVEVPDAWIVAGPGFQEDLSDADRTKFRIAPQVSVPEIGLFAARFARRATVIADVEFELLLSPKHTRNIAVFADAMPVLRERVKEIITRTRELGLDYPYGKLSLVEVPSTLRVYGGGWRMDSTHAMPGIFLIRETGFPTARFESRIEASQQTNEDESANAEILSALLENYFENDLSGGNPFLTATRNLMNFQSSPTGNGAVALGYLVDSLVSRIVHPEVGFYSIYYAGDRSSMRTIASLSNVDSIFWAIQGPLSKYQRTETINQSHVWEILRHSPLADLQDRVESREFLNALMLKGEILAEMLLDTMGPDDVGRLLGELRNRYRGGTYSQAQFEQTAQELQLDLNTVIGDWLQEHHLPGFRTYKPNLVRLPDDSGGIPVYETTFYLANEEPAAGLVRLSYQIWSGDGIPTTTNLPPVRIDANSYVQFALHTEKIISSVKIRTYLSLNQSDIDLAIPMSRSSTTPQQRERLPFVAVVDWRPTTDESIVVDDLDEGFSVSVDEGASTPTMPIQSLATFFTRPFFQMKYDQGLPSAHRLASFDDAQFVRSISAQAWGRYRFTTALAPGHAVARAAHFSARLPHAGSWKLDYHDPLPNMLLIGSLLRELAGPDAELPKPEQTEPSRTFLISVSSNGSTKFSVMDGANLSQGWNHVGEYEFEKENVVVTVQPTGGISVYADAIRWTPSR